MCRVKTNAVIPEKMSDSRDDDAVTCTSCGIALTDLAYHVCDECIAQWCATHDVSRVVCKCDEPEPYEPYESDEYESDTS